MTDKLRVMREDGYWYVEASDRRFWWTVNDDLDHVTNHLGKSLSPTGRTAVRVIRAVTDRKHRENS